MHNSKREERVGPSASHMFFIFIAQSRPPDFFWTRFLGNLNIFDFVHGDGPLQSYGAPLPYKIEAFPRRWGAEESRSKPLFRPRGGSIWVPNLRPEGTLRNVRETSTLAPAVHAGRAPGQGPRRCGKGFDAGPPQIGHGPFVSAGFRGFWLFSLGTVPAFLPSRRYFRVCVLVAVSTETSL